MTLERFFVAAGCILVAGVIVWGLLSEWREYRELSRKVRLALPSQRCRRCGGEFRPWRGDWGRVNACIEYRLPRQGEEFRYFKHEFALRCRDCRKWTVFWVRSDGELFDRNKALGLGPND